MARLFVRPYEIYRNDDALTAEVGSDNALKHFNCYSSTKPIDRSHLTTGHVVHIKLPDESLEFWICLSPACDMVPGQKEHHRLKDCLPFVSVRLHPVSTKHALENSNRNIFLFLDIANNIDTFCILKDGNLSANPIWEQMFARNNGKLSDGNMLQLGSTYEKDGELSVEWFEATIVAQLRSEYALNLLQRMGSFLSRPGLGINFKAKQKEK